MKKDEAPKLIHQVWVSDFVPPEYWECSSSFRLLNPSWQVKIWADSAAKEFFIEFLEEFRETYSALPPGVYRADFLRIAILYVFGGVYVDIDCECLERIDHLVTDYLPDGFDVALPRDHPVHEKAFYNDEPRWMNDFMIARPGADFLRKILERIAGNVTSFEDFNHPFDHTGPDVIYQILNENELCLSTLGVKEIPYWVIHPLPNVFGQIPFRNSFRDLVRSEQWRKGETFEFDEKTEGLRRMVNPAPTCVHYWWHSYVATSNRARMIFRFQDSLAPALDKQISCFLGSDDISNRNSFSPVFELLDAAERTGIHTVISDLDENEPKELFLRKLIEDFCYVRRLKFSEPRQRPDAGASTLIISSSRQKIGLKNGYSFFLYESKLYFYLEPILQSFDIATGSTSKEFQEVIQKIEQKSFSPERPKFHYHTNSIFSAYVISKNERDEDEFRAWTTDSINRFIGDLDVSVQEFLTNFCKNEKTKWEYVSLFILREYGGTWINFGTFPLEDHSALLSMSSSIFFEEEHFSSAALSLSQYSKILSNLEGLFREMVISFAVPGSFSEFLEHLFRRMEPSLEPVEGPLMMSRSQYFKNYDLGRDFTSAVNFGIGKITDSKSLRFEELPRTKMAWMYLDGDDLKLLAPTEFLVDFSSESFMLHCDRFSMLPRLSILLVAKDSGKLCRPVEINPKNYLDIKEFGFLMGRELADHIDASFNHGNNRHSISEIVLRIMNIKVHKVFCLSE